MKDITTELEAEIIQPDTMQFIWDKIDELILKFGNEGENEINKTYHKGFIVELGQGESAIEVIFDYTLTSKILVAHKEHAHLESDILRMRIAETAEEVLIMKEESRRLYPEHMQFMNPNLN